jgi:protocatechuate 3,4-dioxygenase alpha subunit
MSRDDAAALTPFQPVGPYFHVMLRDAPLRAAVVAGPDVPGPRITIEGAVLDGARTPVADALVEIWQADADGRYAEGASAATPAFTGYGRVATDGEGRFSFVTIKPGVVHDGAGLPQAPHLLLAVLAPGILARYWTRIYFEDETANGTDPVLGLVPEGRRKTLLARRAGDGIHHFTVVLQGEDETVFFEA